MITLLTIDGHTIIEITNQARIYRLTIVGDQVYLDNEREESMAFSEKDLFDIIDDYFRREL